MQAGRLIGLAQAKWYDGGSRDPRPQAPVGPAAASERHTEKKKKTQENPNKNNQPT